MSRPSRSKSDTTPPLKVTTAAPLPPSEPQAPGVPLGLIQAAAVAQAMQDADDADGEETPPANPFAGAGSQIAPVVSAPPAAPLPTPAHQGNPFAGPTVPVGGPIRKPVQDGGLIRFDGKGFPVNFNAEGNPYVRMIEPSTGRVCPIAAPQGASESAGNCQIIAKLIDGWQFIVGEPTMPRTWGGLAELATCDAEGEPGWYPKPRGHNKPSSREEALLIWFQEAMQDSMIYAQRQDLDKLFLRKLGGNLGVLQQMAPMTP